MAFLSWTHYCVLLSKDDEYKLKYYMRITKDQNLSVRELKTKIKNMEYERIDNHTKNKLIENDKEQIQDFIKNPILIKNNLDYVEVPEKILKQLILEDLDSFLKELESGFSYIESEYKIKFGDRYNYIDLLLYNIEFNCYVVVQLKITELKKEHIG